MPTLQLQNISKVSIGGKGPGVIFSVETDAAGVPLDVYWHRKLMEEGEGGNLVIIANAPEVAPPPPPSPAAPETPAEE
jgi:hypothetical protein